jgi:hypothetical protein
MSTNQPWTVFGTMSTWWSNWKRQRAALMEINGLAEPELSRVAQDVGLNAPQMRTLAGRWPDSADLLSRRLAELQLDERAIGSSEPAVLQNLQRVCGQCSEDRLCARDLKQDQESGQWREYCPNVATLDAMRTEDRDRRWMRGRKWP